MLWLLLVELEVKRISEVLIGGGVIVSRKAIKRKKLELEGFWVREPLKGLFEIQHGHGGVKGLFEIQHGHGGVCKYDDRG